MCWVIGFGFVIWMRFCLMLVVMKVFGLFILGMVCFLIFGSLMCCLCWSGSVWRFIIGVMVFLLMMLVSCRWMKVLFRRKFGVCLNCL